VKGGRRFTHLQNQTVLHILVTKLSHEGNILAASTSGLRRSRPPGNCLDLALSSPPLTKPIYWYVLERKHGALSAAKSRHLAWKHFRLPPFPCKRARYRSPASPTRPTAAYYLACSNATSSLLRASHLCLKIVATFFLCIKYTGGIVCDIFFSTPSIVYLLVFCWLRQHISNLESSPPYSLSALFFSYTISATVSPEQSGWVSFFTLLYLHAYLFLSLHSISDDF